MVRMEIERQKSYAFNEKYVRKLKNSRGKKRRKPILYIFGNKSNLNTHSFTIIVLLYYLCVLSSNVIVKRNKKQRETQ